MNNREWLYSLDVADLSDWFDAEHVETEERALDGDTDALNAKIAELTAELDAAKQQISRFDAPKSAETSENPASKCEISDFDDSRDKLEADIRQYANPEGNTGTLGACWERKMFEFLDRQVAITEEKTRYKWVTASADEIAAWRSKAEKLQAQVDGLKAERVKLRSQICKLEDDLVRTSDERDNWKANCEDWKKDCERYRSKFGKCLDYADAIHALMDDEGMA